MPSRKKGRGRVIIASDCILKATDFLEKKDEEGNVIERARRIICPGLQEDNWWTAQDVVKQVNGQASLVFKLTSYLGRKNAVVFPPISSRGWAAKGA